MRHRITLRTLQRPLRLNVRWSRNDGPSRLDRRRASAVSWGRLSREFAWTSDPTIGGPAGVPRNATDAERILPYQNRHVGSTTGNRGHAVASWSRLGGRPRG